MPRPLPALFLTTLALATGCAALGPQRHADAAQGADVAVRAGLPATDDEALLDEIGRAHFRYFVAQSDPVTGLTRDRSQAWSPSSVAAVGFSLTAWPVAARRGWVSRAEAASYAKKTLTTLWRAPQGPQASGVAGHKGLFYHFIDPKTAARAWNCELSTIDTALLMAGVRFAGAFFDGQAPDEVAVRTLADQLYRRVDWAWALDGGDRLSLGWTPEKGFLPYHWGGYNEAMIMLLLGLGSPTHPLPPATWAAYHRSDQTVERYGQRYVPFGPLFGHQYSHAWVDFRGMRDATNARLGWDWFENSRRATLAQQGYAIANPKGFRGYGALDWGLTACDGPGGGKDVTRTIKGKPVTFHGYLARGAPDDHDDGTLAPTAAAASLPFAPEIVLPTLRHWRRDRPEIWGPYGFQDAFNPTFDETKPSGWVGPDTLGIDQGPIVLMTENHRSGLVWEVMRRDPALRAGLRQAGFTGGWLAEAPR